jgi:sugar fermentation stimulation protein A
MIVETAVRGGLIPELAGYRTLRAEVKYGVNSRIDLLLEDHAERPRCYVEVKNTTLRHGERIVFPDAVTERGLKHLRELAAVAAKGERAVMFYLVNRPDGAAFAPAWHVDRAYCEGLREAVAAGVELLAYRADNRLDGVGLGAALAISLDE